MKILPVLVLSLFITVFMFGSKKDKDKKDAANLVVVNKTDNSVVIGYNVTLENTVITYNGIKIFVHGKRKKSRSNLSSLIRVLTKIGADSSDLISILSILHRAGTLSGKLVVM